MSYSSAFRRLYCCVKMENVRGKNTKRRHLNKNKKKSWRKVNIDSVEDFLEDERLQDRTGGKVAEKSDESLFFVDTKSKDPVKALEDRKIRKRKAQDKLKDIEVGLKPPPPKRKDKRAPAVLEKVASGTQSYSQKLAEKNRKLASKQRIERRRGAKNEASYDLWGDKLEKEHEGDDPHYLTVTRRLRAKVPKHHQNEISKIPAVEVPHPGASYNPTYDDHQNLLRDANEVEIWRNKQEEKIRRALDAKFPAPQDAPTEESRLKELSAGLFDEDDSDVDVGDLDKLSVNPPVRRDDKKDEKQRRNEKQRKEEERKLQKEKLKKLKDNEFFRLKSIKAEIQEREQKLAERAVKKAQRKAGHLYRTRKLGRLKYEEPSKEIKLTSELVGSLREIKPEGSLLTDRYKSLQKRNIIEPRERAKKQKKYKPKIYEKRSHRAITA